MLRYRDQCLHIGDLLDSVPTLHSLELLLLFVCSTLFPGQRLRAFRRRCRVCKCWRCLTSSQSLRQSNRHHQSKREYDSGIETQQTNLRRSAVFQCRYTHATREIDTIKNSTHGAEMTVNLLGNLKIENFQSAQQG